MKIGSLLVFLGFPFLLIAQTPDSAAIKQVDSLLKITRSLTGKRDFDKALELNATAEKLALEKLGRESASYGTCVFDRGRINYLKNAPAESEKWYLEAKSIREKVLGREHPDYAACLINLGLLYSSMGKNQQAEPLFLEAKEIFEVRLQNREHPNYFNCLNGLAVLHMDLGHYDQAEALYLECKGLRLKVQGKDHPDYASCIQNLANLYFVMGYYDKVESFYLEAKAIREKSLGRNHPEYAQSLNNMGNFYYRTGNFEKAESFYLEGKALREKLGRENVEYCGSLINLGNLYSDLGNFSKAELLYLEAIEIFEQRLKNYAHPFYLNGLSNLGALYKKFGLFDKSEKLFLQSQKSREQKFGVEHPDYANSLNQLAMLYHDTGQNEKAEPLYLQAKMIREKVLGKEHPEYADMLNNLANIYSGSGQFSKAEAHYLEARAIVEKVLGKGHRKYAYNLNNLANLYERQNRYSESDPLLQELFSNLQSKLFKSVLFMSERELAGYNKTFEGFGNILKSYMLNRSVRPDLYKNDLLPSIAYDHALFQKGFILNAATRMNALSVHTPETREISLRLKGLRQRLSSEYSKPVKNQKNIAELEEKANSAEKQLAGSLTGYDEAIRNVKWEDVRVALKNDQAAIEFISFKVVIPDISDSIMYGALLLKPSEKNPIFIPLFEEKSLDSLLRVKSERKADYVINLYSLSNRGAVTLEGPKRSLYEMLWKPMEGALTGINTIYFSPSGLLHRINLDAIPVSETETLADRYDLIELNSTRQLVLPSTVRIANNEAVLFGGIQFEPDSILVQNEPMLASRSRGALSFSSVDSTLRGGTWSYLSGTEREVNSLEKIMQGSGFSVQTRKSYLATEESFKNIGSDNNPSPRILHIATHGYFFPDPDRAISANSGIADNRSSDGIAAKAAPQRSGVNMDPNEPVFKISDHPMLRSGLIMAGGNASWQGKQTFEGREDGILTAYEISQMNLSNTELVVLSACETGLGDIQGNEGVYGLQRAFKIAGAKYLIMSLWQVPDKQTSLLMTIFYKKWLEEKMAIPEAFHAAQKQLRESGLEAYYWAGFVLME